MEFPYRKITRFLPSICTHAKYIYRCPEPYCVYRGKCGFRRRTLRGKKF